MSVQLRRWFTANLEYLLHRAGSPTYRALARFTTADTEGPEAPFEVARRAGLHPRSLPHSTIHDLVTGRRESVPDGWVVSMFVIACACWGARHGSRLLPDLSPGAVQELLRVWQQRRADYETLLRTPKAAEVVEPRVRVGVVPLLADRFQSRTINLDWNRAVADADSTGRIQKTTEPWSGQTTVLAGTGGVGKTQLAADFATRTWHDQSLRLAMWVTADSRVSITTAYAEAAHRLLGVDPGAPDAAAQRLLEWMGSTDQRWLVVLDDVHRPADMLDLWPSTGRMGRVVVTTRRRDPALHRSDRVMLPVGVFTHTESLSYLRAKLTATSTGAELDDGAADLADTLGHLPLALAQAAAYQLDRGLTCRRYRDRFLDHSRKLAEVLPNPDEDELPDGYRHTIATTWSLSIDLADRFAPRGLATPLLHIAALLDPAGTPLAVFTTSPILSHLAAIGFDVGEDAIADALAVLHRLSLVTLDHTQAARMVSTHALVQRAVRDTLNPERRRHLARTAADALLAHDPAHPDTVLALARLLGTELQEVLDSMSTLERASPVSTEPLEPIDFDVVLRLDGEYSQLSVDLLLAAIDLQETLTSEHGPDHPRAMVGTLALGLALATANQMDGQRETALVIVADAYEGLRDAYAEGTARPEILGLAESIHNWVLHLTGQDSVE